MPRSIFATVIIVLTSSLVFLRSLLWEPFVLAFKIAFDPSPIAERFAGPTREVIVLVFPSDLARVRSFRERQLLRDRPFSPGLVLGLA